MSSARITPSTCGRSARLWSAAMPADTLRMTSAPVRAAGLIEHGDGDARERLQRHPVSAVAYVDDRCWPSRTAW